LLPKPGETVHGSDVVNLSGGKGANQAVSVAANNAKAVMIGAVGTDDYAVFAKQTLIEQGVEISNVISKNASTGVAFIFVEDSGENLIVVSPGANAALSPADAEQRIRESSKLDPPIVLTQMELPLETVSHAAAITAELGGRFVLNLAPSRAIEDTLLAVCDPVIVNESEASALVGRNVDSLETARVAVMEIAQVAKSAVITLGADGAVFATQDDVNYLPAEKVRVVDTTGAGDAFVGALAASLARGADLNSAVASGIAAGTIAVQHFGAQAPKGK
jgi:ribokinase